VTNPEGPDSEGLSSDGFKPERPAKLVLCVIDAMAPAMLERAVAQGVAPMLATLIERGRYIPDCVAAFPSVTPVCAASIVTGVAQDEHHIPAMNWFHREEDRYVEYGSSFRSAQRFGITRQLTDTVYNMNRAHLSPDTPTVFETLDDADRSGQIGQRTAGTTYLMYRGRHRHEPQRDTALTRFATRLMRHPVMGPRELFYADIFASRSTGCRSGLGMPGVRDRHTGCVSAYMVEHDLFDFLLLSLPDNDWYSHKHGPEGQLHSIAQADLQLARVFNAGGGIDQFLAEHAVIAMADHSQAPVQSTISLQHELADLGVLAPKGGVQGGGSVDVSVAQIAVCPSQRAAMVYALNAAERDAMRASVVTRALALDGVDLVIWLERDAHDAPREAVIASPDRGELRFAPSGSTIDTRGRAWSIEGELAVLQARIEDGRLIAPEYPDALARVWSSLICPTSGEVLLSAAPGYEFLDWGGAAHVGGGSHGSLHASDSLGALVLCGVDLGGRASNPEPAQWAIRDIAPLVRRHFAAVGG
jgi:predicted AlkP superfamily pyrophosphatase or phosphodiesterase